MTTPMTMPATMMTACVNDQYGPPEVVHLGEQPLPAVRPGEVRVRVRAASVTTGDGRLRAARFPAGMRLIGRLMFGLRRPRNPILGMDFAGEVEATGDGVTGMRVGDRVFGAATRGAHAQYVTLPATGAIVHSPPALTDAEAAAVPFGAGTALAFLRDFAKLQPGQKVLVVGASGGVGTWAVQLARHLGAEVTGVCSTANVELVRSLGAHHVIDYAKEPIARAGAGYDLVFDTVGATTFAGVRRAMAPRGLYLPLEAGLREIGQAIVTAFGRGQKVRFAVSSNTQANLTVIAGLISSGALRPVVDRVYPMAQIVEAYRQVEGRHKRGSVIVAVGAG